MRVRVMIPMILVLILVFGGVGLVIANNIYQTVSTMASSQMKETLSIVHNELSLADNVESVTTGAFTARNLSLAHALAEMINSDAGWLEEDRLKEACELLGVNEAYVTDEEGIVKWASDPANLDLDFKVNDQTRPFMRIIADADYTLSQEPMPRASDGQVYQYAGVARLGDEKGIVQVGTNVDTINMIKGSLDIQSVIANTSIGDTGGVFVIDASNNVIADSAKIYLGQSMAEESWLASVRAGALGGEHPFEFEFGQVQVQAFAEMLDDNVIVAYIPLSELSGYRITPILIASVFGLVGLLLILNIFYLVITRQVIKPIDMLNAELDELSHGAKVNIDVIPARAGEVRQVAFAVNDMLDRLSFSNATIRDLRSTEVQLQARLKQQELVTRLSEGFTTAQDITSQIAQSLSKMGEFLGVSRVLLAVRDETSETGYAYRTWVSHNAAEPSPAKSGLMRLAASTFPGEQSESDTVLPVYCNDVTAIERYSKLGADDIKAFVWVPVYVSNGYKALVSVEDCGAPREWTNNDIQLIRLYANILSVALARSEASIQASEQSTLLAANNRMASRLLAANTTTFDTYLTESLGVIGSALATSRVIIWKSEKNSTGQGFKATHMWWDTEKHHRRPGQPSTLQFGLLEPAWLRNLEDGKSVRGVVAQLSQELREQYEDQGVYALLLAPVTIDGEFWGFVEFSDMEQARLFSAAETGAINNACYIIGDAIVRNKMMASLSEARSKKSNEQDETVARLQAELVEVRRQGERDVARAREKAADELASVREQAAKNIAVANEQAAVEAARVRKQMEAEFTEVKRMMQAELNAAIQAKTSAPVVEAAESVAEPADKGEPATKAKPIPIPIIFPEHEPEPQPVPTPVPVPVVTPRPDAGPSRAAQQKAEMAVVEPQDETPQPGPAPEAPVGAVLTARSTQDEQPKSPQEFEFVNIFHGIVDEMRPTLEAKELKFQVYIDRHIPKVVLGAPDKIVTVATTLLDSAIDGSAPGGQIKVDTKYVTRKNAPAYVQMSISDKGGGLSEEKRRVLVQVLQAPAGAPMMLTSRFATALLRSKEYVEEMNGRMWVESEMGAGTTYHFTFDLATAEGQL